jgi:hypothetical protein
MEQGQDQVRSKGNTRQGQVTRSHNRALPLEKQIELDLRLIARKGKDLNAKHCKKLLVFPRLQLVVAAARPLRDEHIEVGRSWMEPHAGPVDIRDAARAGIERLLTSGADDLEQYGEVLMLLFGFAQKTRGLEQEARWLHALAFYKENANFRRREASDDNFQRRIFEDELLPALVKTFLEWEEELGAHNGARSLVPRTTIESVSYWWANEFWWLFRLDFLMRKAAIEMDIFLQHQHDSSADSRPVRGKPASVVTARIMPTTKFPVVGIVQEPLATSALHSSLFSIAVIWHIVRHEWGISESRQPSSRLMEDFHRDFQARFEFSRADHEWLERALERALIASTKPVPKQALAHFAQLLTAESDGRVVLMRFRALTEACDCLEAERVNERCAMHMFILYSVRLTEEVKRDWESLAFWQLRVGQSDELLHLIPTLRQLQEAD